MAESTTVLLIPGAWHPGSTWSTVAKELQKSGYNTQTLDLPTNGPKVFPKDFNEDVDLIRETLQTLVNSGQKIAVVTHSYSSAPAIEAIKDFEFEKRQKEGKSGGVIHLIFCAAFVIDEGNSLLGAFGGKDLPWFKISDDRLEVNPDNPRDVFYNDLSDERAEEAIKTLVPFSYMAYYSPITYASWKYVPSTYIYTLRDNAIPFEIQKMMVEGVGKGYPIRTVTLDTSHSPMLSKPVETANTIHEAIEI